MSPPEDKEADEKEASKMATEIVFFDVETTVPSTISSRQHVDTSVPSAISSRHWILEFGAIIVCPRKLVEIESYSTLIRPKYLSVVAEKRASGLTRKVVSVAPLFEEVADRVFEMLDGRVWAGHNIQRFDCHRIEEAFADIDRPAPKPAGILDTLTIIRNKFGNRAGDLKDFESNLSNANICLQMATLASHFGLGMQTHRSLDDVRMNLEVFKKCATVLFLESSLPEIYPGRSMGNSTMVTRSMEIGRSCSEEARRRSPPICLTSNRPVPYQRDGLGKVMERAKEALRGAQGSRPLSTLLRHSRSLLR